jgi:hypothetical protein
VAFSFFNTKKQNKQLNRHFKIKITFFQLLSQFLPFNPFNVVKLSMRRASASTCDAINLKFEIYVFSHNLGQGTIKLYLLFGIIIQAHFRAALEFSNPEIISNLS